MRVKEANPPAFSELSTIERRGTNSSKRQFPVIFRIYIHFAEPNRGIRGDRSIRLARPGGLGWAEVDLPALTGPGSELVYADPSRMAASLGSDLVAGAARKFGGDSVRLDAFGRIFKSCNSPKPFGFSHLATGPTRVKSPVLYQLS